MNVMHWTLACTAALLTLSFVMRADHCSKAKKQREADQRDARKHVRTEWGAQNDRPENLSWFRMYFGCNSEHLPRMF